MNDLFSDIEDELTAYQDKPVLKPLNNKQQAPKIIIVSTPNNNSDKFKDKFINEVKPEDLKLYQYPKYDSLFTRND